MGGTACSTPDGLETSALEHRSAEMSVSDPEGGHRMASAIEPWDQLTKEEAREKQ
jgi:hypothetical protein